MSITTDLKRLQDAKADLKTAIESKGVTVPSDALLDDYPALVSSIPGERTIKFYDSNGTLVASYTGQQAQSLTNIPATSTQFQVE